MIRIYLIFSLSFLFSFSYSQISISDLVNISEMDTLEFKIFAIDKGYSYYSTFKREYEQEIRFETGGSKWKHIREESIIMQSNSSVIYFYYSPYPRSIYAYVSSDLDDLNVELQVIYKDLDEQGFKLFHDYGNDEGGFHEIEYRNDRGESILLSKNSGGYLHHMSPSFSVEFRKQPF